MRNFEIRTAHNCVNKTAEDFYVDSCGDVYLKNGSVTVGFFPGDTLEGVTMPEVGR